MDAKEFIKRREDEVEDLCENWPKSYWAYVMEQYHKQRLQAGQHETIVTGTLPDDLDEAMRKAFDDGWVFLHNKGYWFKDGWKNRSTKEIYEKYQ